MAKSVAQKNDQYRRWKLEHTFGRSKGVSDKYNAMMSVRTDYRRSRDYLETGCDWEEDTTTGHGGSYFTLWEKLLKSWGMWYKPFQSDEFRSNVKSPATTGRVEAALHKLKSMDIRFVCLPTEDSDKGKAKIIQELLNHLFSKGKFKFRLATWYKDALIYGTGIARVYYMKREREVRLAKVNTEEMSKDELKQLRETKGSTTFWKSPETVTEYDDIVIEPVPLTEFFPDPNARCIHGDAYTASWVVRRRLVSFDQFKAEFSKDPNCFDVDRVKPSSYYRDEKLMEAFEFPHDIIEGDFVEILERENAITDDYAIVANDVLIRGSYGDHISPLPYNHKQITYVKIGCIEYPHQFYWKGIGHQLLALQGEEEILKNMIYDAQNYRTRNSYMVNAEDYDTFMEAYNATAGRLIPIKSNGRPLNQVAQFIPQQPVDFAAFNTIDMIRQDQTTATQFDPSQLASVRKDLTATQSMLNKEVVDMFIQSTMEAFTEGLITAAELIVADMQQMYKVKTVKKILGVKMDASEKPAFRKIRLPNKSIEVKDGNVDVKDTEEDFSFFEVKGEYLDLRSNLDIQLSAESLQVPSKALDAQMSQQVLMQLMPFAIDPSNPATAANTKLPLVNAKKLIQWFVDSQIGIPKNVLLDQEISTEVAVNRAIKQNHLLDNGEVVEGRAGEPEEHINIHDSQLSYWLQQAEMVDEDVRKLGEDMNITPELVAQDPESSKKFEGLSKERQSLQVIIDGYVKHIEADKVTKFMESETLMNQAHQMSQQLQPQMGGMPAMQPPMPGEVPGRASPDMGGMPGMMGGPMQPPMSPQPPAMGMAPGMPM